jgi:hypothetical protein
MADDTHPTGLVELLSVTSIQETLTRFSLRM